MQPSLPSALPQHCTSSLERICNESNSRRIKGAQNAFSIPRRIPVLRPSRVVLRDLNLPVNKEAAYLQIYGTTPLNACHSCLEGQGPFYTVSHCEWLYERGLFELLLRPSRVSLQPKR